VTGERSCSLGERPINTDIGLSEGRIQCKWYRIWLREGGMLDRGPRY
jgi:hypothetical protein